MKLGTGPAEHSTIFFLYCSNLYVTHLRAIPSVHRRIVSLLYDATPVTILYCLSDLNSYALFSGDN